MLHNLAISLMLILLTGCAFLNPEQYSQKTLVAVSESEQRITQRIDQLGSNQLLQAQNMNVLEAKISSLSDEVALLKSRQMQNLASKNITFTAPTTADSAESSNIVVTDLEPQPRSAMVTLGALEKVYIDVVKSYFVARVDTGATTSSINAIDIQKFERDGKKWVRFHVSDDQVAIEQRKWVESPIIRHVKIRQASMDELERRPVVELWIKIGSIHEKAQFTLTDRTQMDFSLLLGREFIQDVAIVDVSRDYIESKPPQKAVKQ